MKHDNWYNEEYMSAKRQEVVEMARDLLEGEIDFLSGVRGLSSLKHEVSDNDFDPDFTVFVAIDSETDHMSNSELRASCSELWLNKCDEEVKEVEELNREQVVEACKKLISRFTSNA
jgi:hypothetical protein